MFDFKHHNVIIYKANRITNPNNSDNLSKLLGKIDVKEYVIKVYSNEDDYTDEARMRIFGKNMKSLREIVSNDITINDVLELDFFKNYDYEKYEITFDGLKRIKYLRSEDFID